MKKYASIFIVSIFCLLHRLRKKATARRENFNGMCGGGTRRLCQRFAGFVGDAE